MDIYLQLLTKAQNRQRFCQQSDRGKGGHLEVHYGAEKATLLQPDVHESMNEREGGRTERRMTDDDCWGAEG